MFKPIKVIQPRTKKDLEECKELDAEGKLAHGGSYPNKKQLEKSELKFIIKEEKLV